VIDTPFAETSDTLCIILHFGTPKDTVECLESLRSEIPLTIAVVDNDPQQSFDLTDTYPHAIHTFRTGGLMGFAEANNFGVGRARNQAHRYVLFLNNDTVVKQGAIEELRATLMDEGVGLVGPAMPFFDRPDALWAAGGKVSKFLVTIDGIRVPHKDPLSEVDYLPGAGLMTTLDLWDDIGGLPEKYFLAFEEAEFALEVSKRDKRVVVNRKAQILHKVGMSSDRQPKYYYNTVRNRIRFGQYLFGKQLGFVVGAFSGLLRSYCPERLKLWARAISDEVSGRPLDASALQRVEEKYRLKEGR